MADTGRRMTDAEFRRLRAKIKGVYQQAYEDIYKKNLDFVKRHERREAQYRQMMDEGKITKTDFDMWMRGQVFQGKQWEAKRKQMEATLLNADQMAMDMINGSRVRVFADNANFIGYELEQHGRVDTSFGLYDINSVKRLLMEEPDLLPPRSVGKDESYKWYNKQIQGAVTQGIIQGEKLTDIAKRIGQLTGERCMNAMLRNARTMHTGAENAGRIEGMHQAQRLGIEVQKKWLATLDGHTRDAHRDLDGQVRDVDDPFESPLGKIMFPGDPSAFPGNVWNCRCTLTYVYPKYPDSMAQRLDNITGEVIDDMTYREWEHWKETGEKPQRMNVTPAVQELSFAEKIANMQHEDGEYTHEELRAAGKLVYDEYARREAETLSPLQARYDSILDEMTKLRENGYRDIFNDNHRMTHSKFREKYGQDFDDMDIAKHMKALRNEKTDLWLKIDRLKNGDLLADVLKEVRPLAGELGEKWMFDHIANARRNDTVKEFFAALQNYPKKWVEQAFTAEHPKLLKTTGRAYNAGYEIYTDGDRGTTYHELAHQFERSINHKDEIGIRTEEGKFYKRRTEGIELQWLGHGYAKDEKTRRDDFIHPYMGKDYGGSAYELVSMGFEDAYTDPKQLAKDPDMQEWIYGLLALK